MWPDSTISLLYKKQPICYMFTPLLKLLIVIINSSFVLFIAIVYNYRWAKLQATNRVPRPVDRGTATRYGG